MSFLTYLPVLAALFLIEPARAGSTPTTTLLASSANPSVFGATVTLTATVTENPPATGKVTFYDAANILGTATLNGSGVAKLNTIMIQAGNRKLRATYSGDASYAPSTSSALPQAVHTVGGNSFTFKGVFPVHSASATANIVVGDFNGDGTPDIAYPSSGTDDVSVLIGDGIGGFAAAANQSVGGPATLVAAADFNGDGKLDLFCTLSNSVAPFAQILFGNGDGTFQPAVDVTSVPASHFFQLAVGDFDGNGTADIALQNGAGSIFILLGNGNGTFAHGTTVASAAVPSVAVGDFRGIGAADLATGGTIGEMLLNNADGTATFTSTTASSLPALIDNTVITTYIADLHGTGHEDLITGAGTFDLHVVQSNGDGTFQTPLLYGPAPSSHAFASGDFDGNRSLDLITYGTQGWDPNGYSAASVLYNNGDGTFKSSVQVFGPFGPCVTTEAIVVADFNHDGIADFATADAIGGVCVWLGTANPALAATTTTSADVTVPYQANANFQMTATVTSAGGTVNAGDVNFIVPHFLQSGSGSEFSNSATVSIGTAAAQVVGSGPLEIGVHNGYVTYYGASGFAPSGAQPVKVTVTGTATTTTASAAAVSFSATAQIVTLKATVSSAATVTTGSVTFFVTGLGSVSGEVVNGAASAVLGIPAGQAVGSYAINAIYSAVAPLADSSDNSKSLTISKFGTTTTASAASAIFSSSAQPVTLKANVTSADVVVNSGTVSFTVPGVGSATSATVSSGAASAVLTIPAGQAPSTYTIQAVYNGTANLNTSSDNSQSLTISSASSTTIAAAATATYNVAVQNVTLSANVTSAAGAVNAGTVTFKLGALGSITSSAVSAGVATAVFPIPAGAHAGVYTIEADYSGGGGWSPGSDTAHALTILQVTPVITWANPASFQFGSALGSGQLNATANAPGSFVYNPAAGTVLPAGNGQTLSVTFMPGDAIDYISTKATVSIDVTKPPAAPAQITVTNTVSRDAGTQDIVVTIGLANTGGTAADNVQLTNAKIGSTVTTCVVSSGVCTSLPVAVGTIAPGGTVPVTIRFPSSVGSPGATAVLAVAGTYTGGKFNGAARITLPPLAEADLRVSNTTSRSAANSAHPGTFDLTTDITITNNGPAAAGGTVKYVFVSSPGPLIHVPGCTEVGNTRTCPLPVLKPGQSFLDSYQYLAFPAGTLTTNIILTGTVPSPNPADNEFTSAVTIPIP